MKYSSWRIVGVLSGLILCASGNALAELSYTGGTYSQDFHGLPTIADSSTTAASQVLTGRGPHPFSDLTGAATATGMDGWFLANFGGNSSDTEFRVHAGNLSGGNGRGVLSLGSDTSTDRALGALPTSNQISSFGLQVVNNTGGAITSFTLSYTGEQWRRGNVTIANTLLFEYGLDKSPDAIDLTPIDDLSFKSVNAQVSPTEVAINGNDAANQLARSATIPVNWPAGQTLVMRWTIDDLSGQDDGLAIDGLTFSAVTVPEPSAAILAVVGLFLMGLVRIVSGRRAN